MLAIYGLPIGLLIAGTLIPWIGFRATRRRMRGRIGVHGADRVALARGDMAAGRDRATSVERFGERISSLGGGERISSLGGGERISSLGGGERTSSPNGAARSFLAGMTGPPTRGWHVTVAGVGRRFPTGVEALRDVSLRLNNGDFLALLGPSGCGKSTLLRLISGLDRPNAGALNWDAGTPPGPGDIGYVFQDATLLPWASERTTSGCRCACAASPETPPAPTYWASWTMSASRVSRRRARRNSPVACECVCRSPARWSPNRACC